MLPTWLQFFFCEHWKVTVVVNLVIQRQETDHEWVWMLVTQANQWRKTLLTPQQRSNYELKQKNIQKNHFECISAPVVKFLFWVSVVMKKWRVCTNDWNFVCIVALPVGLFFFSLLFHVSMLRKSVWSQWRVAQYEKTNALWWTILNAW